MESLAKAPFSVLRPPRMSVRMPKAFLPSKGVVMLIVFVSYWVVVSGFIYDVIVEPPSFGQEMDERSGRPKPVAILMWRLNGQYIIEGISAGFLMFMCGAAVMVLDKGWHEENEKVRTALVVGSVLIFAVLFGFSISILGMKVGGYSILNTIRS